MFGKLIKNDFKASAHYFGVMYLAIFISVSVLSLAFTTDSNNFKAISSFFFLVICFATVLISLVLIFYYFYSSLYSNQGYLTFTLPVKSYALLISKAIISFFWILLSYIISLSIIVALTAFLASKVGEDAKQSLEPLLELFIGLNVSSIIKMAIVYCFKIFIGIVVLIAAIFFSMTLSGTRAFQKSGIISALFVFFLIYITILILYLIVIPLTIPGYLVVSADGLEVSFNQIVSNYNNKVINTQIPLSGDIFALIVSFLLFAGTSNLMRRKINLK